MAKYKSKRQQEEEFNRTIVYLLLSVITFLAVLYFLGKYPILLLIPIGLLVLTVVRHIRSKRLAEEQHLQEIASIQTISDLYSLTPREFEEFVGELYRFDGFDVEVTPATNDGGKDLVMYKNQEICVVEVKRYAAGTKVTQEQVQKLHSAMYDSGANYAIFVTTSSYTKSAIEFAERNQIVLIDGPALAEMIQIRNAAYMQE